MGSRIQKVPKFAKNLTGLQAGFYTQDDVRDLVKYGKQRGVRIVPEFDVPGHAGGLFGLIPDGL